MSKAYNRSKIVSHGPGEGSWGLLGFNIIAVLLLPCCLSTLIFLSPFSDHFMSWALNYHITLCGHMNIDRGTGSWYVPASNMQPSITNFTINLFAIVIAGFNFPIKLEPEYVVWLILQQILYIQPPLLRTGLDRLVQTPVYYRSNEINQHVGQLGWSLIPLAESSS